MTRKISIEEINIFFKDNKFVLLNSYSKNNKTRVIFKDKFGFKYDVVFRSLLRENFGNSIVEKRNPFSLYNISLWLKLNNKDFELSDKNIYNGSKENLEFYHDTCQEYFYMSWERILQGQNCSVCSGHQVGKYNNLEYLFPEIAKEWDYSKNNGSPKDYTGGSHYLANWVCFRNKEHKWNSAIKSRTIRGDGCPACAGKVVTNLNKLSVLYPEIAFEWHPTKNGDLTPYDVSYGSHEKVWWLCNKCLFPWPSTISDRTIGGNGCPQCSESKGEKEVRNYLNNNRIIYVPEYKFHDCRNILPLPFDFYLPDYNVLIEYDGIIHYKDKFNDPNEFKLVKKRDKIKTKYCKDNNIKLIRIPYWEFNNIEKILTKELL